MRVVTGLDDLRAARRSLPEPFGLVPTMGALHEGHLSLVRRARAECASVGASIFINPTQFGPTEDVERYPRDRSRDLGLFEAEGVDLVWTPEAAEMYPDGFQTWVTVEELTHRLEGDARPGHFRGVTTVVAKLFNAFQPQRAYFGQKDAQQALAIRRMVSDLNFPVEIIVCPTVREPDGLAMSSRNAYLEPEERRAATVLFRALIRCRGGLPARRAARRSTARTHARGAAGGAAGAGRIRLGRGSRDAGGTRRAGGSCAALDGRARGGGALDRQPGSSRGGGRRDLRTESTGQGFETLHAGQFRRRLC